MFHQEERIKMCGIIATKYYNSVKTSNNNKNNEQLRKKIRHIYENQKHRGTQGGGMLIKTTKANKVTFMRARTEDSDELFSNSKQKFSVIKEGDILLAHHRFPTTNDRGFKTTHPFVNETGDIALIHNGTISNWKTLHKTLKEEGHDFETELVEGEVTDSEVALHLIEKHLGEQKRTDKAITEAITKTYKELQGNFALLITFKGNTKIWAVKNNNPIEVYSDRYGIYASSELPKNYEELGFKKEASLEWGDIAKISEKGCEIVSNAYPNYNNYDYSEHHWSSKYAGNSDNDDLPTGMNSYNKRLKEALDVKTYTEIPLIVEDMIEDLTTIVLEGKKLRPKARMKKLIKELDKFKEHYEEKLNTEAKRVEEDLILQEDEIKIQEQTNDDLRRELQELEYDYAEWKANIGLGYDAGMDEYLESQMRSYEEKLKNKCLSHY